MRFVQFADVHLDSTIGGALGLPAEKRSLLRGELRSCVRRACELALEHRADLVLVPGDLFDYESLLPDTPAFLAELFQSVAPARVFIAPGNHDSLRPGSPYLASSGVRWPENVHIFTSPSLETLDLPELGCSVSGVGHAHRGVTDRLASLPCPSPNGATGILVFHGSRDGHRPSEKESVLPFSDDELAGLGFAYAAVGHYHSFARIDDASGRTRGAYSGCVQGRGLDEAGVKGILFGEIGPGGRVSLECVEVAPRRVVTVEANVTGARDTTALLERVESAMSSAAARDCDIVHLSLTGSLAPSVPVDALPAQTGGRFFHFVLDSSRLEPEYDIDALIRDSAASPLRSAFARRMLELREQSVDPEAASVARDALFHGLAALDGRKPEPRDAG